VNATRRFAAWCAARGIGELAAVQPVDVAAFVKELQGEFSAPSVNQRLVAAHGSTDPDWGAPKIHGELLNLGSQARQGAVAKVEEAVTVCEVQ
jgi:hypothetical protein